MVQNKTFWYASLGAVALGFAGILVGVPSWSVYCAALCVLCMTGGLFTIYWSQREKVHNLFGKIFGQPSASVPSLKLATSQISLADRQQTSRSTSSHHQQQQQVASPARAADFTNVQQTAGASRRLPVWPTDPLSRKLEFGLVSACEVFIFMNLSLSH